MVEVLCRLWPGIVSAQEVSRLVAGAPRHLDHRMGRVAGWEGLPDGKGGASFHGIVIPDGRGASRVRRASRPTATVLESDHDGPDALRRNGSRGSSLALLGTSTIGWEGLPDGKGCRMGRAEHPSMASSSPMVEVRAACGEPRDRLLRCWNRTTTARMPFGATGLEARRWRSSAPRPSDGKGWSIPARGGTATRVNGSPRWSRCEPRAASLETGCYGAGIGPQDVRSEPQVRGPGQAPR